MGGLQLFLGDSKYDYQAASTAGLDFVFIRGWSEVSDWEEFIKDNKLATALNIASLVEL